MMALRAETLAIQAVLTNVLFQMKRLDPELADAIARNFDNAADQIKRAGRAASSEPVVRGTADRISWPRLQPTLDQLMPSPPAQSSPGWTRSGSVRGATFGRGLAPLEIRAVPLPMKQHDRVQAW